MATIMPRVILTPALVLPALYGYRYARSGQDSQFPTLQRQKPFLTAALMYMVMTFPIDYCEEAGKTLEYRPATAIWKKL